MGSYTYTIVIRMRASFPLCQYLVVAAACCCNHIRFETMQIGYKLNVMIQVAAEILSQSRT